MSKIIADVEACIPALRRYASALLRDPQEVDDLVQDCLARALGRLHMRRSEASLRAWLFSILHNQFIDRLRRAQVRYGIEPIEAAEAAEFALHPSQDGHIRGQELLRALQALPAEQRATLLLVTVEELSYADVARVTGVPVGTVMSRLSRARERLRQLLEEPRTPVLRRVE